MTVTVLPAAASEAVIVVGLTEKIVLLLDDTVRLPVRFAPLTVKVLETVLPLTTLPNASDVGFTVMVGTTHVPETETTLSAAPPPLMVMVPECEPAAEGL